MSVGDSAKTNYILDFVTSRDVDIIALCETWLKGDASDSQHIAEFAPADYQFLHWPRPGRRCGVIGILIRCPLSAKTLPTPANSSFEFLDLLIITGKTHLHLTNIYHPSPSSKNKSSNSAFFSETASLLEILATHSGNIMIGGDFNLQLDDPNDSSAINFLNLLELHGLTQHVHKPTHKNEHILDLLITHANSSIITDVTVHDPGLSDHQAVMSSSSLLKPARQTKEVKYRKIKSMNITKFEHDLAASPIWESKSTTLDELITSYDNFLEVVLDAYAPI